MIKKIGVTILTFFVFFIPLVIYSLENPTIKTIEKAPPKTQVETSPYSQLLSSAKNINSEVVGWFHLEGVANEPIVSKPGDQGYYLRRNFSGKEDLYGSLILGEFSKGNFDGVGNNLIYGHNTDNNSKFGNLDTFLNEQTIKDAPILTVFDGSKERRYQLSFVVEVIDGREFILQKEFKTDAETLAYNKSLEARAIYSAGLEKGTSSRMMFLQTCKYYIGDERYVYAFVELEEE